MGVQPPCFLVTAKVLLCTLGTRGYVELPPLLQMMKVALVPLGLVSVQALLISCSTHSAKLPFSWKAGAVIVIVEFSCIQDYEEQREGAYV